MALRFPFLAPHARTDSILAPERQHKGIFPFGPTDYQTLSLSHLENPPLPPCCLFEGARFFFLLFFLQWEVETTRTPATLRGLRPTCVWSLGSPQFRGGPPLLTRMWSSGSKRKAPRPLLFQSAQDPNNAELAHKVLRLGCCNEQAK